MNFLEQEFCVSRISIEVYGLSALLLLQESVTQHTDTFEHKVSGFLESLYHFIDCGIPFSFERTEDFPHHCTSDPGPRNVQCPYEDFIAFS